MKDKNNMNLKVDPIQAVIERSFIETNPNATAKQLSRGQSIASLADQLYEFIETYCWRREDRLAVSLKTSARQIKYAKELLKMRGLIRIRLKYNKNRSNPKHEMVKVWEEGQGREIKTPVPVIQWSHFDDDAINAPFLNEMTIEDTLDLYEKMRFRFIPLHYPITHENGQATCSCKKSCGTIGKHPLKKGFNKWDYSNPETYKWVKGFWLGNHPNVKSWNRKYNVGILTDNFSVIDVDPRNGGHHSLEYLEEAYGELPKSLMVETGDGHHYYTSTMLQGETDILGLRGIDVRSNSRYIIAPPSLHKSGKKYSWSSVSAPPMVSQEFSEALSAIKNSAIDKPRGVAMDLSSDQPIALGIRNHALFRIAASLRGKGRNYHQILEYIRATNRARCIPPLPDSELRGIAQSVCKYEINAQKELALRP